MDTISTGEYNMHTLDPSTQLYEGSQFEGLDCEEQELAGLEFEYCVFKNCNFREAFFNRCTFLDCRFVNSDLSLAKLGYSRFSEISFEDCKLLALNWTHVSWPSFVPRAVLSFHRCQLSNSTFYGLTLNELEMVECRVHDVDFREADLNSSNFAECDFASSSFSGTDLATANFAGAYNYTIDIQNNNVKGATFSRLEATSLLESLGITLVD